MQSSPQSKNLVRNLIKNLGRRQPRAGLESGREVSVGCEHLAGVGAADGRFG